MQWWDSWTPQIMVPLVDKSEVKAVADEAEQRLRHVCESLGGSTKGPHALPQLDGKDSKS